MKSFALAAAFLSSAHTFATDGENAPSVQIAYPSPNGFNGKGSYAVGPNLDGDNVLGVEELYTIAKGLGEESFSDLEFDGFQYSAERPSETAAFLFRRGERHYEQNKLDKAERAFKASLRAEDGGLATYSYLYLANIAKQTGDTKQAQFYTARYYGIALPQTK